MLVRRDIRDLTDTQRGAFVAALLALKKGEHAAAQSRIPAAAAEVTAAGGTPNRYDDYVWLHSQVGGGAHRGPAFGAWHREFLRQFEYDLQQVSGDATLTIPYWDWTTARTSADAGWPFTDAFMGGFGDSSWNVTTGPFSTEAAWRVNIAGTQAPGPRLRRRRVSPGYALPTRNGLGNGVLAGLAITDHDVSPFHPAGSPTNAQLLASFRKYLEYILHDVVHPWVGGTNGDQTLGGQLSFPPDAVNDPAFWLHHCNVDRLWAIWQARNPSVPGYAPTSGANLGHNRGDTMRRFSDASWYNLAPLHATPDSTVQWQAGGPWYVTDLPQITPTSLAVDLGDVVEGLTTYRPLRFTVRTPQAVRFTVTGITTGTGFDVPPEQGATVVLTPTPASEPQTASVYVRFQAPAASSGVQSASVTVAAEITDRDGYFAATVGGSHPVGSWTFTVQARPVARPRTALSLVLDRSGSMSGDAGAGQSKYDVLKSSLLVVRDVLRATEGVALVSFDDVVATLSPVVEVGAGASGPGRLALQSATTSGDLAPRGMTAIGQGLIRGAELLADQVATAGNPYPSQALVVLTDGNENVPPLSTSAPVTTAVAPWANRLFAIGLGTPENVSAGTLGTLANYQLITGAMSAHEQRFLLTKYFIQILADATGQTIVTDPDGLLAGEVEHAVPFTLSDADVTADVIALSPLAPALDAKLVAPDGSTHGVGPNVDEVRGMGDLIYRLRLPVDPTRPEGTHGGRWHLVLRLSRERLAEVWRLVQEDRRLIEALHGLAGLPYSVVVQAWGNLAIDAQVPTAVEPGARISLAVRLHEVGLPVEGAKVWAEVDRPDGTQVHVALAATEPGLYAGALAASWPGLYRARLRAQGATRRGQAFEREAVRTTVADRRVSQAPPAEAPPNEVLDLLCCLLGQKGVRKQLAAAGVDVKALRACLGERCRRHTPRRPVAEGPRPDVASLVAWARQVGQGPAPVVAPAAAPEPEGHDHHGMVAFPVRVLDAEHCAECGEAHATEDHGAHDHGAHDHGAHDHGAHDHGAHESASTGSTSAGHGGEGPDADPPKAPKGGRRKR